MDVLERAEFEVKTFGNPSKESGLKLIAEVTSLRQLLSEAEKREREARAAALEEAARLATDWKCVLRPGNIQRLYGHQDAARDIAAKIVALQSEER